MTAQSGRCPSGRATHEPGLASRPGHSVSVPNAVEPDVARLVIVAREIAFGGLFDACDDDQRAAIKELDEASEAFASRVPWEDEPRHTQNEIDQLRLENGALRHYAQSCDEEIKAWREGRGPEHLAEMRALDEALEAIATEARRAETENTGSVHEGAGRAEASPNPCKVSNQGGGEP
jgi:hypothetical protein